jgi:geranylgeranyl diphosphate synthase type II
LSDEEKIATVKRVYDELGIPKQTEHQIASRFDKALSLLNSLDVPDIRKEALRAFAKGLMNRRK